MLGFKLNNLSLIIVIAVASLLTLLFIPPAEAATQTFQWQGAKGYLVRGTFEYDESEQSQLISQRGSGQTRGLKSLTVSFYDPTDRLIQTYNNVANGVAKGNYFEFHFDPTTQKLIGNVDLGGEFAGDAYLKGTVDGELTLFQVESSGKEHTIDRGFSSVRLPY